MNSKKYIPTPHPTLLKGGIKDVNDYVEEITNLFNNCGYSINYTKYHEEHPKQRYFYTHDKCSPTSRKFFTELNRMGFQITYRDNNNFLVAPLCDTSDLYR